MNTCRLYDRSTRIFADAGGIIRRLQLFLLIGWYSTIGGSGLRIVVAGRPRYYIVVVFVFVMQSSDLQHSVGAFQGLKRDAQLVDCALRLVDVRFKYLVGVDWSWFDAWSLVGKLYLRILCGQDRWCGASHDIPC